MTAYNQDCSYGAAERERREDHGSGDPAAVRPEGRPGGGRGRRDCGAARFSVSAERARRFCVRSPGAADDCAAAILVPAFGVVGRTADAAPRAFVSLLQRKAAIRARPSRLRRPDDDSNRVALAQGAKSMGASVLCTTQRDENSRSLWVHMSAVF